MTKQAQHASTIIMHGWLAATGWSDDAKK